ncbi:MAG: hypothetical protein J0M37_14960 [Ignavibacteria bacterium]|nr:hypothetical protein [Ignavibacteria bacterium]
MNEVKFTDDLVCPLGKYPLKPEGDFLECTNCGAKFPVAEGIPLLLIDDAVLPEGVSRIEELKCYKRS